MRFDDYGAAGKGDQEARQGHIAVFRRKPGRCGQGFAVQEFLDQIGAVFGPVALLVVLLLRRDADQFTGYRSAFAVLGIPAVTTVALLLMSRARFPNPERIEPELVRLEPFRMRRPFAACLVGIALCAMVFIDFPMITMHVQRLALVSDHVLPLIYAGPVLVDAFAALGFGWMYDRVGMRAVMVAAMIAAPFAWLVFAVPNVTLVLVGVALWGIGMGVQESILKAVVGSIVPKRSRSTGFGILETVWGVARFLGGWLLGALYDARRGLTIVISGAAQIAALPIFWWSSLARRRPAITT